MRHLYTLRWVTQHTFPSGISTIDELWQSRINKEALFHQ